MSVGPPKTQPRFGSCGLTYLRRSPMIFWMRSRNEQQNSLEGSTDRELRLLSEVQRTSQATQRDLSQRVGIALGVTNILVRGLAQKGYIRVTQAGWKRWLYTLTPAGMARKVQLTLAYLTRFLDHYRQVRTMIAQELAPLAADGCGKVALYGRGEAAELAYLTLSEIGVEQVEVFDHGGGGLKFLGMWVQDIEKLRPADYDRVIIASLQGVESKRGELARLGVPQERILTLVPRALEVSDGN